MAPDHIRALEAEFRVRGEVGRWLRDDLHPMDREDGQCFLDAVKAGEDPHTYFQSAIPYIAFLTDDARFHFLPDIMSTLVEHPGSIIGISCQIDGGAGIQLARLLTEGQKGAISTFLDALALDDVAGVYRDEIGVLRSLIT